LDQESAARAFTRGWSTKSDERLIGRGLGLALVGQVTHRNNGTVEVAGAQDPILAHPDQHDAVVPDAGFLGAVFVGAVFTVRFPLPVAVAP
jgi:signal transduction histidine kinase